MRRIDYRIERACAAAQALRDLGYPSGQRRLLKEGGLFRNGTPCSGGERLQEGDVLTVQIAERGSCPAPAAQMPLCVVYEDEDYLVLDKQSGIAVQPSRAHFTRSLFSGLKHRYGEAFLPRVVTRLDRDTSGLMLIAKHSLAHALLYGKKLERGYFAVLCGRLEGEGVVNAAIAPCSSGMKREISPSGKPAITEYRCLNYDAARDVTGAELTARTGRTHQIRVHMASLGHPLAGDRLYGGERPDFPAFVLRSIRLAFRQPITGEELAFRLDDFRQ